MKYIKTYKLFETYSLKDEVKDLIISVPDFPKKDVEFKDFSKLLGSPKMLEALREIAEKIKTMNVDVLLGLESRGFIIGSMLSALTGLEFQMIRKSGKLPPPVISLDYKTEYSTDTIEIKEGEGNALIIDDVLATGGTGNAAKLLAEKAGYNVIGAFYFIDLTYIPRKMNHEYFSYIQY